LHLNAVDTDQIVSAERCLLLKQEVWSWNSDPIKSQTRC